RCVSFHSELAISPLSLPHSFVCFGAFRALRSMLLYFSVALLAGAALAAPSLRCRNETAAWPTDIQGLVLDEASPEWENLTARWSTYSAPTFNELFLPHTIEDISLALGYLSAIDKPFLAQSGGHGYAPSLHVIQNATLINMINFGYINVNDDGTATVGSGSRFRDVVAAVGGAGREFTVGNCPCVGAVGATIGGGLGRLQGLHGLSSDALLSARVVLWNGTIAEVSADSHSDLFWGIRGAGQNFGIIAEAVFQTYPATNGGLQYSADLLIPFENLGAVVDITNDLLNEGLAPALALLFVISYNAEIGQPTVVMNIVYAGPEAEGQAVAELFRPYAVQFQAMMTPWTELANTALFGGFNFPCETAGPIDQYHVLARNIHAETLQEQVQHYAEFMAATPGAAGSSIMIEAFAQQAVQAHSDDFSAFPHRQNFHTALVWAMTWSDDSVGPDADAFAKEWRDRFSESDISGYENMHVYQNYANDDEPLSALYGVDTWRQERLTALKDAYDPHGHFDGYHPVPKSAPDWS
ncbi:hypothetical protein S7711_07095, partial [Stachybotrys chartarum IBT 7711]